MNFYVGTSQLNEDAKNYLLEWDFHIEYKALKMFLYVFYLNHIIGIVYIGNNIY